MPSIRARDLRTNITEMGYERGVVHTLELALEELSELRVTMRGVTELLDQAINEISKMVVIGDAMHTEIKLLKPKDQGEKDGS